MAISIQSIGVGVGLGLVASFIFKNTSLYKYPKFEVSLLFLFCYLCYATAETLDLSGILALFFHGVVLSHYNSFNLVSLYEHYFIYFSFLQSSTSHVASEQIFATISTITETIVYFYMGMCVFTGKFHHWNISFALWTFLFCVISRALHIFPLSFVANCFRSKKISLQMQIVMWFTGLRGAVAFALSENMPGERRDVYSCATLSICLFTTVVCGGYTERVLSLTGLRNDICNGDNVEDNHEHVLPAISESIAAENYSNCIRKGAKEIWKNLDENYLQEWFGGPNSSMAMQNLEKGDSGSKLHQKKS